MHTRRAFVRGLLFLGLAFLPSLAQAQYTAPGYYYPQQMPAYSHTNSIAPAMGAPVYVHPQGLMWFQPPQPNYYFAPQPKYVILGGPQMQVSSQPAARPVAQAPMPARVAPKPMAKVVEEKNDNDVKSTDEPIQPGEKPVKSGAPARDVTRMLPEKAGPTTTVETLPASKTDHVVEEAGAIEENNSRCRKYKFQVFGEALYWNAHNTRVPFAQEFDGVDPLLSVPRGPLAQTELEYALGFRGGFGIGLSECSKIVATYTHFEADTSAIAVATGTNVLQSPLLFPNTVNASFAPLVAEAEYDIRLMTGDVDFKYALIQNNCVQLHWLAGVRYALLEETFSASYQEVLGNDTIGIAMDFHGIGPRAGLEGEYHLKCGMYGYGKGVLNLLAGKFNGNYEQGDVFGGLVAQTEVSEKRLVPVTEFEVGGGWTSPKGYIRVSGGYYVGAWFNTLTTNAFVRGVQENDFTTNGDNFRDVLTFDGLVGRFEFRY